MRIIMGKDGTTDGRDRIRTLAENTLFFRTALVDLGFIVYGTTFSSSMVFLNVYLACLIHHSDFTGNDSSPIVPMMIFIPAKIRFCAPTASILLPD